MNEKDIRGLLAIRLKEFRLRAGLTTKEVGDKVGKSYKTVSGWEHERGQPDADMLFALCELYGIKDISVFYTNNDGLARVCFDLSNDEKELIGAYRSLNERGKEMLLETSRAFISNPPLQKDAPNETAI